LVNPNNDFIFTSDLKTIEMKNLEEFKKLIERYETITIEEIRKEWKNNDEGWETAQNLTGFGGTGTCTLCKAVGIDKNELFSNPNCSECVYEEDYGCIHGNNEKTYNKIEESKTPKGLLTAFRNRAKHLRKTYKNIL
jgi:hypothetical protein